MQRLQLLLFFYSALTIASTARIYRTGGLLTVQNLQDVPVSSNEHRPVTTATSSNDLNVDTSSSLENHIQRVDKVAWKSDNDVSDVSAVKGLQLIQRPRSLIQKETNKTDASTLVKDVPHSLIERGVHAASNRTKASARLMRSDKLQRKVFASLGEVKSVKDQSQLRLKLRRKITARQRRVDYKLTGISQKDIQREERLIEDERKALQDLQASSLFGSIFLEALPAVGTVGLALGTIIFALLLALSCWAINALNQRNLKGGTRKHVESLARCSGKDEVEKALPSTSSSKSYDCAIAAASSGQPIRLEGMIEGPRSGDALISPLSGKKCVLYSASVARQLHEGIHPVPLAFASSSTTFTITIRDAEDLRVEIKGEDVFLFDMHAGRNSTQCTFAAAQDHWQDFVLTHRSSSTGTDWQSSSSLRSEKAILDFQECFLEIGAQVTVVGELVRAVDGSLSLRPCQEDEAPLSAGSPTISASRPDRYLTSWERGIGQDNSAAECSVAGRGKVLVSDDPSLFGCDLSAQTLIARCGICATARAR